jgi:hypothetical protein
MVNSRLAATYFKRVEQKYVLSPAQYRGVLGFLNNFAKEDEYGLSTVYSIYYDSDNFALTRNCLNPAAFKKKLRLRSYGILTQNGTIYWELKKNSGVLPISSGSLSSLKRWGTTPTLTPSTGIKRTPATRLNGWQKPTGPILNS